MKASYRPNLHRAGQSIVEVIIAVAILSTAVAASLTLTMSALNAQKENEGYMIATNLAREGIEVVRNIRDSNWLAERPWNEGLYAPESDYTAIAVFDPESGAWVLDFQAELLDSELTRVWRYVTGHVGTYVQANSQPGQTTLTRYRRLLELKPICADQSLAVAGSDCPVSNPQVGIRARSMVSWTSGGRDRNMEIIEMLYDWR